MILVFDLDGTICFDGVTISDGLLLALTNLSNTGNTLIFASARPIRDMLPLLSQFPNNFLIGGNGSIVRKKGKIEVVQPIENDTFERLKKLIEQHDLDYLVDSDWNYSLCNRQDEKANINSKIDALNLAENVTLTDLSQAIKCNLLNLTDSSASLIKAELSNLNLEIVSHAHTASLDLTAKNINKYTTLKKYFPQADYIAFGNDANDTELLRHANLSVAVGYHPALNFADEHLTENEIIKFLEEEKWQK